MIRSALPADATRLAQIEQLQPLCALWGEKGLADEMRNGSSCILCWEEGGVVAGFLAFRLAAGFCEILNVAVHPAFCRRGIGFKLLSQTLADVRRRGGDTVTLEVNASNGPAVMLYEKAGFKRLGVRKKFYNGLDDAWIMGVDL